jgi:1,2-beta-oligoglucan phosphorylase
MPPVHVSPTRQHLRLENAAGLVAEACAHGALTRLEALGHSLLLHPATHLEAGPANVHLRLLEGTSVRRTPLLGPLSPSVVTEAEGALVASGTWAGLDYRLALTLADDETAWSWRLDVTNRDPAAVRVDAVYVHDPALASPDAVADNPYYVSQYLDITPIDTAHHGVALGVRQNMPGRRVPWLVVGALRRGTGWATDARQLVDRTLGGLAWTGLDVADLPSRRLQHEHALAVVQDAPVLLGPGETHHTGFFGLAVEHHPEATGPDDVRHVEAAVSAVAATDPRRSAEPGAAVRTADAISALATAPALTCRALTPAEVDELDIAAQPGSTEHDAGVPVTWRTGRGEVVTAARELAVLRPHGQILRTGDALTPDPASLTTTTWMAGTFHSQVTRGHVGRDPLISGRRSYLGLFRGHGLRVLLGDGDDAGWELLDTPSAWLNGLDGCWWWYAAPDGRLVEVAVRAPAADHELTLVVRVVRGGAQRLLVTLDVGPGPEPLSPPGGSGVELGTWRLAWDGAVEVATDDDWLLLDVAPTRHWRLALTAPRGGPDLAGPARQARLGGDFWAELTGSLGLHLPGDSSEAGEVAAVAGALPWFTHNALVHYLAPRGLEQFSGGGWGTRDVCQGPVGLLTALDRHDEVRDVLLRVLSAQNARGDWPQAFEFLPPVSDRGQQDSHGDVVYWPLLAVGEHLLTTGDAGLLAHEVPFVDDGGATGPVGVEAHLRRALDRIESLAVAGTPLPAYGHGDWNDSLQPADHALAERLVSTWTSVLQVQALDALAQGLDAVGVAPELASDAAALATRTREEIAATMVLDGLMPGYLLFDDDGDARSAEPLVHPRDTRTGLTYGILPWVHAVAADVLDPAVARHHLAMIEQHLLGPDGARLFDRPVAYRGGPMSVFQRAEASTFWGREIGLMYVHAHLRYAEALARVGDGAGLLHALALASPWCLADRVPQSLPRQRSCYYSSSDGAFTDRYDAQDRYPALMAGEVPLEGGWRIYSSGPGLALRLVVERLLGLRRRGDAVEIDPVLPTGADGLVATVRLLGRPASVTFRVGPEGVGVRRVVAAGRELDLRPVTNPHRRPGACVRSDDLRAALAAGPDLIVETF